MKEVNIDFIQLLDESKIKIREVINIEVKCKSMNYYQINTSIDRSKIGVYVQLSFDIEYIEESTSQLKYIEVIKGISDFITLDNPVSEALNCTENIKITDKGFKLIDKNRIYINATIII